MLAKQKIHETHVGSKVGGCGGQLDRQPCLKGCTHLSSFYKEFDIRVKRGHPFRLSSSHSLLILFLTQLQYFLRLDQLRGRCGVACMEG